MANTVTVTNTGKTAYLVSKPKYVVATIGDKNYIFDHVLKDSTKFSQDDNTTNTIENEVSDTPIKTNVTLGSYQFEATIEDIQADLLVDLCGFTKATNTGVVYAPASYVEKTAQIAVVLDSGKDSKLVAYVAPSVQLNSKLILESLSTSMAGFTLAGTAKTGEVTVTKDVSKTDKISTPLYIDYDYKLPTAG